MTEGNNTSGPDLDDHERSAVAAVAGREPWRHRHRCARRSRSRAPRPRNRQPATLTVNVTGSTTLKESPSACCKGAPPVLEFDQAGNLVGHWGGPGAGYEWPGANHGITVDYKDNVWIGGNDPTDAQVLKFTRDGKFLLQVGHPGKNEGSNDTENFWRAAKVFVDPKMNEAYVADGYGNRRVAVIDADTGTFKRYWGAYGGKPDDAQPGSVRSGCAAGPTVPQPGPLRRGLERRARVRVRPREQPHPGLSARRHVRQRDVHRAPDARRRRRVGHRLLARPRAEVPVRRRRTQRKGLHRAATHDGDPHELRRRRPAARPVLRRAQHRHRLAGQRLHGRDVRGEAPAEVREQGHGTGDELDQGTLWPREHVLVRAGSLDPEPAGAAT